jgi:hypothetical protein
MYIPNKRVTAFTAEVGLSSMVPPGYAVIFVVEGDDKRLKSVMVKSGQSPVPLRVSVEGIDRIQLRAIGSYQGRSTPLDIGSAWWGSAYFTKAIPE